MLIQRQFEISTHNFSVISVGEMQGLVDPRYALAAARGFGKLAGLAPNLIVSFDCQEQERVTKETTHQTDAARARYMMHLHCQMTGNLTFRGNKLLIIVA